MTAVRLSNRSYRHRILARTALLVLAVFGLLGACSPSTGAPTPTPGAPQATVTVPVELPVTLSLSGRFSSATLALLERQIAAFEAQNPDIFVEIVRAPRAADKRRERYVDLLETGDSSIDIMVLRDQWLPELAAHSWLMPLEGSFSSTGLDFSGFYPAVLDAATVDGILTALPWAIHGGVLYYRTDLLESSGLQPPGSWSELQTASLAIAEQADLSEGYLWPGAPAERLACITMEFIWTQGGDLLDQQGKPAFDGPEARAGLQQMLDLVASGASPADVAHLDEDLVLERYAAGDAALMRSWPSAWNQIDAAGSATSGRTGIAPLPASCLFSQNLGLSAHSRHPEQALRFMAFLSGYDQQAQLAHEVGQPPALESVYSDPDVLAGVPHFAELHDALSISRAQQHTLPPMGVSEAIYSEVNLMLAGEQTAEATAMAIQNRLLLLLGSD